MSRIISEGGRRYRTLKQPDLTYKTGDYWQEAFGIMGDWNHEEAADLDAVPVEELPRVPNWPLPGPAPQFISDDRSVVARDGDTVVLVANDGSFIDPCVAGGAITIRCRTEASDWPGAIDGYGVGPIGEIADYMDANGWDGARAYLIQRRDPTEDIEHDD